MTIKVVAPAKINLTLHVTGQRDDGYHLLDSLVMFADFGDEIALCADKRLSLTVSGAMADGVPTDRSNLVWRAAEAFGATARIHLTKHLPPAAGIGGGSSDAAATLRGLAEMTGQPPPENVLALGADVPVCLAAKPARMRGIGEIVENVSHAWRLPAVLINPRVEVSTPDVFRHLPTKSNAPMGVLPDWTSPDEFIAWIAEQRNDLQKSALEIQPVIGTVLDALSGSPECRMARMSGSGATCFGLYPTLADAHRAADVMRRDHPGWWVQPSVLGGREPLS